MQNGFARDSRLLAEEFHDFLRALEAGAWPDDAVTEAHARLQRLSAMAEETLANPAPVDDPQFDRVRQRLHDVAGLVDHAPAVGLSVTALRHEWQAFRGRAYPTYEALVASLHFEDIHVPALRPTNYARNVFHVLSGLVAFVSIQYLMTPTGLIWTAGTFAVTSWALEALRRAYPTLNRRLMAVFAPMAHQHEYYRVNSGTWYATALLILALFGSPMTCTLAVTVLALGDPAAALIGRRFGRIKIVSGRSLEGSLAFVLVSGLAAFAILQLRYPQLGFQTSLALALAGAVAGSLAELYSRKLDDNFTIPVAVGLAVSLVGLALP